MQRLLWLTDIHLNFVTSTQVNDFLAQVSGAEPSAVLLGGDLAEAHTVGGYLVELASAWACPIYFVLGNHDFYFGSIRRVREQAAALCREYNNLIYLTNRGPVQLNAATALIGHDGWADARVGDYMRSLVMMNDYRLIEELSDYDKLQRWEVLKKLGNEAAAHVRQVLPQALNMAPEVLMLTHVPPLREACWYDGQISDDEWAPHFVCLAMGEVILEIMHEHRGQRLTVLCGHTHGAGVTRPLANVTVLTGKALYGEPAITETFTIGP